MNIAQDKFIEELYRNYFSKITIYASARLKDKTKAQDIAQDVFHEAVLHVGDLMTHDNPGGWLMKTAKNKLRESERERRRYLHRFLSLDSEVYAQIASSDSPVEDVSASGETPALKRIEQALSTEELHLLKRFVFDKASHLEIAEELGITVWASQKRLERIRKNLFEVFPEQKNKK